MIKNFTKKLFIAIAFVAVFTLPSCNSKSEDIIVDEGRKEDDGCFVEVTAEQHFTKSLIASELATFASSHGIPISAAMITGFLCDVDTYAITYKTEGVNGEKVLASGVVAMPTGTTSYDHLLSIQHSTLDIDKAPSKQLLYYEMAPVVGGHVIVMADYLGYGASQTSDRQHPYLHTKYTGTACADMIEAAREFLKEKEIKESKEDIKLMGYSQGGTATVATVLELEKRGKGNLIKEVDAGGGAYDLESIFQTFTASTDSYPMTGFIPYMIRGMVYGEGLKVDDKNLYSDKVMSQGLNKMFSTAPLSQWHSKLGDKITDVLNPDFFKYPDFNGNADVIAVVAALRKNSLVNSETKPKAAIKLYHSKSDDFVPYSNCVNAHEAWSNSTMIDLTMSGHVYAGAEFMLRYMGLWDLVSSIVPIQDEE